MRITLLTAFMFITGVASSVNISVATMDSTQSSTVEVTKVVDDFTNHNTLITEKWRRWTTNNGRSGIGMFQSYLNGNAKALDLMGVQLIAFRIHYSGDLGCLSNSSSKMLVRLENGNVITLYHMGETDCDLDGQTGYYSPIKMENIENAKNLDDLQYDINEVLNALVESNVEKIRLVGSRSYTEQIPSSKHRMGNASAFFKEHIIAIRQYK
mgnify:CR=1 FL=1